VRDLWAHADLGVTPDGFTATVEPHGALQLKVTAQPSAAPVPTQADPPGELPAAGQPPAPGQPPEYPYLSDLPWASASSFFGPVERDMSNGGAAAGDGRPLTIGGARYDKGLGLHAPADLRYDLGGSCSAFAADIGLDGEVGAHGAAVFQVLADGALIYDSGELTGGMPPLPVYLDIAGVHELRLVVAPVGGMTDYAHADWAGARVACGG
jgi:alpha-galactosidase